MNTSNSNNRNKKNGLSLLGSRLVNAAVVGVVSGVINQIAEDIDGLDFTNNNDESATEVDDECNSVFIQNNIEITENDIECF